MYQIKNKMLYFTFLLLFPFAVYSMSDCDLAFHSKARSKFSQWMSQEDLTKVIENVLVEQSSDRLYKIQYKNPQLNVRHTSDWISYEMLNQFVKNVSRANIPRVYRIRYRPSRPNLARRVAEAGTAGAKTVMGATQNAANTVGQTYKQAQEDARTAAGENSIGTLKLASKATTATAMSLGTAGVKTATNAVSNVGKKVSETRANRVAARADRRAQRAQARVEAKEQKEQERKQRAQELAQRTQETLTENLQKDAEFQEAVEQAKTDQANANQARASRYQRARQALQNPVATGRAAISTVTDLLPDSVVAAGKNVVSKVKRTKNENTETETQQGATRGNAQADWFKRIEAQSQAADKTAKDTEATARPPEPVQTASAETQNEGPKQTRSSRWYDLGIRNANVRPWAGARDALVNTVTERAKKLPFADTVEQLWKNNFEIKNNFPFFGLLRRNKQTEPALLEHKPETTAEQRPEATPETKDTEAQAQAAEQRPEATQTPKDTEAQAQAAEQRPEATQTPKDTEAQAQAAEQKPETQAQTAEQRPESARDETGQETAKDTDAQPHKLGEMYAQEKEATSDTTRDKAADWLKKAEAQKQAAEELLNQRISDYLDLGTRTNNALSASNIFYMRDLLEKSEAELRALPDIGKKSIENIKEQLQEKGQSLKDTSSQVKPEQNERLSSGGSGGLV